MHFVSLFQGTIGSDHFLHAWFLTEILEKYCIPPANFQGGIILDTVMNYNTTEHSQNMTFSTKVKKKKRKRKEINANAV